MPEKVVVLSGAGVSAESGIKTFRDGDGLWRTHSMTDLATPEAFARHPQRVLDFYNERRAQAHECMPNAAHLAIATLETGYEVVVITQNVDNLHERAGSSRVIHLHGELAKVRSTRKPSLVYEIGGNAINLGDACELGSQLRPHIVWFGETVPMFEAAVQAMEDAAIVLVVGTSLAVYPAAGLLLRAPVEAEKVIVSPALQTVPEDYVWYREQAGACVPGLVQLWLDRL